MKILDAFQFLRDGLEEAQQSQLISRPSGVTIKSGEVLLALEPSLVPHVLIPVEDELTLNSGSLRVSQAEYMVNGTSRRWLDVSCSDPELSTVFERFAEDICERLSSEAATAAVSSAFADWKSLLQGHGTDLSRAEVIGLIGELEVLERLAITAPAAALDLWTGPSKSLHDFTGSAKSFEVKTTEALDGGTVTINGLNQLEQSDTQLHLVVVRLQAHPVGRSIEERVETLISLGLPRRQLLEKLAEGGYHPSDPGGREPFRTLESLVWEVDDEFPRIRKSDLMPSAQQSVSRVSYSLSLGSLPPPLDDHAANAVFDPTGTNA